jgi:RNA polymerase sigma-70 factor, ECF subfamily
MTLGTSILPTAADYGSPLAKAATPARRMDEAAFHALYSDTAPRLWGYVRRASSDPALADDIMQETFLRFLRADLRPMDKFQMKAYLYRTASTLLMDHWRRLKRERTWSLANLFGGEARQDAEQGGDAMAIFRKLKPQEQSLLWLAYVEGFDHREIAVALQLNEKSVRVLLFRARKKLARILGRQGIGTQGAI